MTICTIFYVIINTYCTYIAEWLLTSLTFFGYKFYSYLKKKTFVGTAKIAQKVLFTALRTTINWKLKLGNGFKGP